MKQSIRRRKWGFSHAKMTESPRKSVLFQQWKRSVSGMGNTDLQLEPNPFPVLCCTLADFCFAIFLFPELSGRAKGHSPSHSQQFQYLWNTWAEGDKWVGGWLDFWPDYIKWNKCAVRLWAFCLEFDHIKSVSFSWEFHENRRWYKML